MKSKLSCPNGLRQHAIPLMLLAHGCRQCASQFSVRGLQQGFDDRLHIMIHFRICSYTGLLLGGLAVQGSRHMGVAHTRAPGCDILQCTLSICIMGIPDLHATAIPSRKYPSDVPCLSGTFCKFAIPYDTRCPTIDKLRRFPRNTNLLPSTASPMTYS